MEKMILGKTNLEIARMGFGVLPIQRVEMDSAISILRKAYESGVTFFDTARAYSDSEEKLGNALSDVRQNIVIATKSHGKTKEEVREHLKTSLDYLKTDYIDIYQFHNMKFVPKPGGEDGLYDEFVRAKEEGKIKHIGITSHSIAVAEEAVDSGLFDTIQFPLSLISAERDLALIKRAKEKNIGVIAMKALAGGLIDKAKAAFVFMRQYDNVVPIWGIQHEWELDEFLGYEKNPPKMDEEISALIKEYQDELAGDFCRGCGYCMPCPVGIKINNAARMSLLLRRAVYQNFLTPEWQKEMDKINDCLHCNQCVERCPYGLNTPELLQKNLKDYEQFLQKHQN
ncbi:MAG: aldo/keto reductase [Clostridia bacterium]